MALIEAKNGTRLAGGYSIIMFIPFGIPLQC